IGVGQQDADVVVFLVDDNQIETAVVVQVGCRRKSWPSASTEIDISPERAVAVANQKAGIVTEVIGRQQIEFAVAVRVRCRHGKPKGAHSKAHKVLERRCPSHQNMARQIANAAIIDQIQPQRPVPGNAAHRHRVHRSATGVTWINVLPTVPVRATWKSEGSTPVTAALKVTVNTTPDALVVLLAGVARLIDTTDGATGWVIV